MKVGCRVTIRGGVGIAALGLLALAGCSSGGDLATSEEALIGAGECEAAAVGGRVGVCHATDDPSKPYIHLDVTVAACRAHTRHAVDFVSADAACEPACTATGPGPVDQAQLDGSWGYVYVATTQTVGQSFTIGATGRLVGIEPALALCGSATTELVQLDLVDAALTRHAVATLPVTALPSPCGARDLDPTTIGPSYFDLSDQCIDVTAGEVWLYTLSLAAVLGTCDLNTFTCVGGPNAGHLCDFDDQCQVAVGHNAARGDVYAGGQTFVNGIGYSDFELTFKTFVE